MDRFLAFITIILVDQGIKAVFLSGFRYEGECISLPLVFNTGVAFSMFSFLGEYLKYIQLALLSGVVWYSYKYLDRKYHLPIAIVIGAGLSNVLDRFVHGGVVDYIYWHCGFDFAVFNFADMMIDFGVAWIFYLHWRDEKNV